MLLVSVLDRAVLALLFGPRTPTTDSAMRSKRLKYILFCNATGAYPVFPTKPANLMRFVLWLAANGVRSGWRRASQYTSEVCSFMCAAELCAGGHDHCCEQEASCHSNYGGLRGCEDDAEDDTAANAAALTVLAGQTDIICDSDLDVNHVVNVEDLLSSSFAPARTPKQ